VIITLDWRGPVGVGAFPDEPEQLAVLETPGVYLRVKTYQAGRTVSYVGQSTSLLSRIDQHITALLGLQATRRDADGKSIGRGDFADRLAAYGDITAAMAAAADDAARMRFFTASCDDALGFTPDHLNLVEGALKTRLESRSGVGEVENIQGVARASFDDVTLIESDFSQLAAADRETLATLIGTDAIEISDAVLGLSHAE